MYCRFGFCQESYLFYSYHIDNGFVVKLCSFIEISIVKMGKEKNNAIYELLDFEDLQEFEFAERGLLAAPENLEIWDENGKLVWTQKAYEFVQEKDAPGTANPSLWRNTQLNHIYGLFEVTDGIYQVRGYDVSSITFIKGKTGWIVFDPLTTVECAEAALQLVNEVLGERPITGVVISHTHGDHYGGIRGIISSEDLKRKIPIIVPDGFEEHAVSENLYVGNAMGRRAGYQYGTMLEPGEMGSLGIGLGIAFPKGKSSYISPTDIITKTGEVRIIDGVKMYFQMTPGTEAPAEMNTWFPDKKALWMAENCVGTLHNLYTLRGAQIRDGNAWAKYIMEAITLYGDDVEVLFQSHNWPHFGNDVILEYMENTAAMYKFINDQTLMYVNQGYTSNEISHMIHLPKDLETVWYTRPYYGTVSHNAKAVYQRYMGWYDSNPVHLNALPPSESAKKYVEYLGDTNAVLQKARQDFDRGEYQWVAEITNVLVFANPQNMEARYLCADALEQLGYQAESGTWRSEYLSGALELREGNSGSEKDSLTSSNDMLPAIQPYMVLDFLGIHLDSNAAQNMNMKIDLNFTNNAPYLVTIKSGVLLYQEGVRSKDADVHITLPKEALMLLLSKESIESGLNNGTIKIEGDLEALYQLSEYFVEFDKFFNIVEP
jgi:alkyl sulfatase BDS1-like metallo-beta-lactamase superfamily hydrolase